MKVFVGLANGGENMTAIEWRSYEVGHCMHPQCSTRQGGAWKMVRFPAFAFLLKHPQHGAMLFDTGYSEHFFNATQQLPERLYRISTPPRLGKKESLRSQLAQEGMEPASVTTVMLSHLHGDHIGGLRDFPSSKILCSREALEDLRERGRVSALKHGLLPELLPPDFDQRVRWIEDTPRATLSSEFCEFGAGYDLWSDGSMLAVSLPGHAPGHYGLLFRAVGDEQVFLIADAVWSSQALIDGIAPPAFVTSWLGNTELYRATLGRLQRLRSANPHLRIIPSHCAQWRLR